MYNWMQDDPDDKDEFEEDMMREMDERMLQAEKVFISYISYLQLNRLSQIKSD